MKRLRLLVLLSLALAAAFAATAHADYRAGSVHPMLDKHHRLALPLPRASSLPKLTETPSGRLRLATTARYRAANWKGRGRVSRDRVTVTIAVARKMLPAGPDPTSDVFRKVIRHRLLHRRVTRRYGVLLPARVSNLLKKWGALSPNLRRRAQALRRVTVDIQQDRDFRRVDGRFDWREGGAWSAADGLLARLRARRRVTEGREELSGEQNPSGTLTLINNTAAGVYATPSAPMAVNGVPQTAPGTVNSAKYATPIAVGAGPVQCFDQGSNGSDPEGFDNLNAAGEPVPYGAGEVWAGEYRGDPLPQTSGVAITEGLAADYSLAWAREDELAAETGLIMGSVKLGLSATALAVNVVRGATAFVSPGAVVADILDIFDFFLANSCKEAGNYFNVSGAEEKGGTFSQTIEAGDATWSDYPGTGRTPYGTQYNPSLRGYEGRPVHLDPLPAGTPGLSDNACVNCGNNNVIEMSWTGYNPCPRGYNCAGEPPPSPSVKNERAELDCGSGNSDCPFPAAGFPTVEKYAYLGLSTGELLRCDATRITDCFTLDDAGSENYVASLDLSGGELWSGISNGVVWQCPPAVETGCGTLNEPEKHNGINTVVYENEYAYSGGSNGVLERCVYRSYPRDCVNLDDADGDSINALAIAPNGSLIAGLASGVVWRCSPNVANDCQQADDASSPVLTLGQGPGETFFAGIENGTIWECGTYLNGDCTTIGDTGQEITSIVYSGGHIFAGYGGTKAEHAGVMRCTVGQVGSCEPWTHTLGVRLGASRGALYIGAQELLYVCSTKKAFECRQLDDMGADTKIGIRTIAVSGEEFSSQP